MKMWIARDRVGIANGFTPQLALFENKPFTSDIKEGMWFTRGHYYVLPEDRFPEVTFEDSPMEVEIIVKSTLDDIYKGLDQYENFLGLVACMRKAQKEANDLIAQVECYEEAMEHIKKAEELEQMVDKWLEGETL